MKLKSFAIFLGMLVLIFFACSGTPLQAQTPKISVKPMSVNFGNVKLGGASGKTIMIKNTGTSDLLINNISLSGSNASEFGQTNNCTTVPTGGSCTITATFNPTLLPFGKKSATIVISSNDPKKPTVGVKLSGNAPPPKISASPMSVNFGSVQADTVSSPQMVTIKNTGTSDLLINNISLSGSNASEFGQTNNCTTVPTGGSCTITATFNPTLLPFGKKSATIVISSNDPKKPTENVKLSGNAPQTTTSMLFAENTDVNSSILVIASDKETKETVAVIGEKGLDENITKLSGFIYISADGKSLILELGTDGLPISLTDDAGNEAVFSNYAASTVDITFYINDNLVGGPVTTKIDQEKLSEYLELLSSLGITNSQGLRLPSAIPNLDDTSNTNCISLLLKRKIVMAIKAAGFGFSVFSCAAGFAGVVTAPAAAIGCASAYIQILGLLTPPSAEEPFAIEEVGSIAWAMAGCVLGECTDLLIEDSAYLLEHAWKPCTEQIPPNTPIFPFPTPPPATFNISVIIAGIGSGAITTSPPCCTYAAGTPVTLTESPKSGSCFKGWGEGCSSFGTNPTCTLTVKEDQIVTANFDLTLGTFTGKFSGTTTESGVGCVWQHNVSGIGSATVSGCGTTADPYTVTFSFTGEDIIQPIPPSEPECTGDSVSATYTGTATIDSAGTIRAHGSIGDGTGDFVGTLSGDRNSVTGTLTINNPVFDHPIVGPLNLTRQ